MLLAECPEPASGQLVRDVARERVELVLTVRTTREAVLLLVLDLVDVVVLVPDLDLVPDLVLVLPVDVVVVPGPSLDLVLVPDLVQLVDVVVVPVPSLDLGSLVPDLVLVDV